MSDGTRWEALRADLRSFVDERAWDEFHAPKDLAVGLNVEAGELLEHFQWRDPGPEALREDAEGFRLLREEVADVFLYCLLLADKLGIDILEAGHDKLEVNREKYPEGEWRGRAR